MMGEFELLGKLRRRLPPDGRQVLLGSGDDAAVTLPDACTATSVDAMVEGVHFCREETTPRLIGRKALATALSDLAAMGAAPGESYVALGRPEDLGEEDLLELVDGLLELAKETEITLAGGDVTRAPVLMLAVTVVGHARRPDELVPRAGAEPDDVLVVTGELGGAAEVVSADTAERLRARQLDPTPRLRSGRALADAGATAMIDLSDGLAGDALHVAEAGCVGLRIDAGALPLAKGVAEVAAAAGRDPLELAASGGEDYELLAALPREKLAVATGRMSEAAETTLTEIGGVVSGEGAEIRLPGGALLEARGYDHFAEP
jgi:thiamine-monophosphate kinase